MRSRRAPIRSRKLVFLGCEGRSEESYGALLNRISKDAGLSIHIHLEVLQPGAGNPLQLVRRAGQMIREIERKRSKFSIKAILLDRGDQRLCADASILSRQIGIDFMIWQDPDHEALLLRHLPRCHDKRPPTGASMAALRKVWPTYNKGTTMLGLAEKIGNAEVLAAAGVEPDLRHFLAAIGFDFD